VGWAGERAPGSQRVLTPSEFLTAADYELPRTDEPCYCDHFTITMKKVRRVKKSRTVKAK